ncbi:MAG: hypothetical protein ACTSX8_05265 [Alphaproteobacteria bacterium]
MLGAAGALGEWFVPSLAAPLLAAPPLSLPIQLARFDPRAEFGALLRRAYPTACTLRDFPTALRALRSPTAWHILRTIVACGLLGTLPWRCVRAEASLRAVVHRRFAAGIGDLHAPAAFRTWALANAVLVRAALQERLFAIVGDLPWLERYFEESFAWPHLRLCARLCMDDVRRAMNMGESPAPGVMSNWHDLTKPFAPRFRTSDIGKTIASAFRKAPARAAGLKDKVRRRPWRMSELTRELRNVLFERRLSTLTERVAPRVWLHEPALASALADSAARMAARATITVFMPTDHVPDPPQFPAYFCETQHTIIRRYGKKRRISVCEDLARDCCACKHPGHAHFPNFARARSRPDAHRACTFSAGGMLFFCGRCCEPRVAVPKQAYFNLQDVCPSCSAEAETEQQRATHDPKCHFCSTRAVRAHIVARDGALVLVPLCHRHMHRFLRADVQI